MSEVTRSLGLPEHAVNYGEVDMHHAIRKGKEHGISFLTPDEIRQQMLPFIQQFNIEANEGCFRLSSPRPTRGGAGGNRCCPYLKEASPVLVAILR